MHLHKYGSIILVLYCSNLLEIPTCTEPETFVAVHIVSQSVATLLAYLERFLTTNYFHLEME